MKIDESLPAMFLPFIVDGAGELDIVPDDRLAVMLLEAHKPFNTVRLKVKRLLHRPHTEIHGIVDLAGLVVDGVDGDWPERCIVRGADDADRRLRSGGALALANGVPSVLDDLLKNFDPSDHAEVGAICDGAVEPVDDPDYVMNELDFAEGGDGDDRCGGMDDDDDVDDDDCSVASDVEKVAPEVPH